MSRLPSLATGPFPHGKPPAPLLVYDANACAFPPRYDAGWSNWYRRYPRRADLRHLLPGYVANNFKRIEGVGMVGYFCEGDNPDGDANGDPPPAWAFGPADAVAVHQQMMKERGQQVRRTRQ